VNSRVGLSVAEHLGKFTGAASNAGEPAPVSPAARFAELLRQPEGIKQAVILSLLLSPPRSLHRE
jgi:hypothetical protein